MAHELVRDAAARAEKAATWLDHRDPRSLPAEVRDFARRRPGAFIGLAAIAGLAAGRLTRSLAGRKEMKSVRGAPRTVDSLEKIPETFARNEENR